MTPEEIQALADKVIAMEELDRMKLRELLAEKLCMNCFSFGEWCCYESPAYDSND